MTHKDITSFFQSVQTRISSLTGFLGILAGIYLSILTFYARQEEPTFYLPFVIGVFLALSGIVIGFIGLFPRKYAIAIDINDLYGLRDEKGETTIDNITQNLMIMNRKNIKLIAEKSIISETIVILGIFSILEVLIGSLWIIYQWANIEYITIIFLIILFCLIIGNLYYHVKPIR